METLLRWITGDNSFWDAVGDAGLRLLVLALVLLGGGFLLAYRWMKRKIAKNPDKES